VAGAALIGLAIPALLTYRSAPLGTSSAVV
jgi:hypothetical protein